MFGLRLLFSSLIGIPIDKLKTKIVELIVNYKFL